MKWNEVELKNELTAISKSLGLHITQAQLLLSQERFLARLLHIDSSICFVWKGGSLILRKYSKLEVPRFTTDIDLLVKGMPVDECDQIFLNAIKVNLHDGFKYSKISKTSMERDTPYGGDRFEIKWSFFGRPNPQLLTIDVCAGDDVSDIAIPASDVFLIKDDVANLSIKIYPPEFIFAEKLETVVRFKTGNTRLKDFIDLWNLIKLGFDKNKIKAAIDRCFKRRGTNFRMENIIEILSDKDYADELEIQKIKRFKNLKLPLTFEIFNEIIGFLKTL
ncbi:MAG: nucleotidyl transferase AbiEii/AbiGii toxin family protein [Oligoflexia bacterium]|nr:nucleotidyl transferase AbiEii/AbiGii toxin family protein [Oligoflexia bacterium]